MSEKLSDALTYVRDVVAHIDRYADTGHEHVQTALDKLRRALDAIANDDTNDTELP